MANRDNMPRISEGVYPLVECIRWYVDLWKKKAQERPAGGDPMKTVNLRIGEAKLAKIDGDMVYKTEVADAADTAFLTLGKFLEALPGQLARDCQLSPDTARKLRARLDVARRAFARDLSSIMSERAVEVENAKTAKRA
jgi:hypothetical protein